MKPNFNKYPVVQVRENSQDCTTGWQEICRKLKTDADNRSTAKTIIVVDCYQGCYEESVLKELSGCLNPDKLFLSSDALLPENEIRSLTQNDVTDDRIFGFLTRLTLDKFFDAQKVRQLQDEIAAVNDGLVLIFGIGASMLSLEDHILVYADMARWEIQIRMRRSEVKNLGINNNDESYESKYKRGYFVDWRACDRHKKKLMHRWDYVLDTNSDIPKLVAGEIVREGLKKAAHQPFSPVPYFDAGPWGGQWMKEVCDLDKDQENFAWCFNCVPEENSMYLGFGDVHFELPSIDVVFFEPVALLGDPVHARFGDEFPIRFDFLDTMGGGNLSLQVHPLTEYIQEKFGIHYTQDESYYLLDAEDDACVYLGLKEGVDGEQMIRELKNSEATGEPFDDTKHVQKWPAKKHDHFLIPGGTVHCSGKNSMVLEISSTPYIFTFKLWDWGRLGMDGKPRPINIDHGASVIQWNRTTNWTKENLVNRTKTIDKGDGWECEFTGLHDREFIETHRYWFTKSVEINALNSVQVFNVIEGREIIVESANGSFSPMVFHYAETFIVPAAAGDIIISPHGESVGEKCGVIKAFVRH